MSEVGAMWQLKRKVTIGIYGYVTWLALIIDRLPIDLRTLKYCAQRTCGSPMRPRFHD